MKYLIAELLSQAKPSEGGIIIIPIIEQLTETIHWFRSRIDSSVESLRPNNSERVWGYCLFQTPKTVGKQRAIEYFGRLLQNELDGHEFLFMDSSEILNNDILQDLAEPFAIVLDISHHSILFSIWLNGEVHFSTYDIPLTSIPFQIKSICGNIHE